LIERPVGAPMPKKRELDDLLSDTNRYLLALIALSVSQSSSEGKALSLRDQVRRLSDIRLRPTEISQALNKTLNHVNKELSGIRKESKGQSKREKKAHRAR
jgi:hypothetical protein